MSANATSLGSATKAPVDVPSEVATFQFIVGWVILILVLIMANKSRLGHVIIYYSLILIILLILVTEYQQIVPYLNAISTVGEFQKGGPSSG